MMTVEDAPILLWVPGDDRPCSRRERGAEACDVPLCSHVGLKNKRRAGMGRKVGASGGEEEITAWKWDA